MTLESADGITTLQSNIDRISEEIKKFEEVKTRLIGETHKMNIANKSYILKSGWRIVALAFNLSDKIIHVERTDKDNEGNYTVTYTVEAASPNGRCVQAVGSCNTAEKSGKRRDHDTETMAHTRAKNRAIADLVGLGEVSAEEMQGADVGHASAPSTSANGVAPPSSPSQQQMDYIRKLGYTGEMPATKFDASKLISQLIAERESRDKSAPPNQEQLA